MNTYRVTVRYTRRAIYTGTIDVEAEDIESAMIEAEHAVETEDNLADMGEDFEPYSDDCRALSAVVVPDTSKDPTDPAGEWRQHCGVLPGIE